jgi:hypothetical protein
LHDIFRSAQYLLQAGNSCGQISRTTITARPRVHLQQYSLDIIQPLLDVARLFSFALGPPSPERHSFVVMQSGNGEMVVLRAFISCFLYGPVMSGDSK